MEKLTHWHIEFDAINSVKPKNEQDVARAG
jgi:hypothetical protein